MDKCDKACFSMLCCQIDKNMVRREENCDICEALAIIEYGGKVSFSAIPEIYKDVEAHLENEREPFSKTSLERLSAFCKSALKKRGMELSGKADVINRYEIKEPVIREGCAVKLSGEEENICFSDLPYLTRRGPVFGIIEEGKVVSMSGAAVSSGIGEIYIETAPAYRKRGYAAACLSALCSHMKKEGLLMVYEAREENIASNRLAKGVGGKKKMRYVRFIGRK